jgi:hypothetical protein
LQLRARPSAGQVSQATSRPALRTGQWTLIRAENWVLYFPNNHYQGHSPASVRDFRTRLAALDPESGASAPPQPNIAESPTLFDLGDE